MAFLVRDEEPDTSRPKRSGIRRRNAAQLALRRARPSRCGRINLTSGFFAATTTLFARQGGHSPPAARHTFEIVLAAVVERSAVNP